MRKPILKGLHDRIIKTFLDIIIMSMLQKTEMSGYDIISAIHTKFKFLASSGTIYGKLYSLERDGLVKGSWGEKKRTYQLTSEGQKAIETILKSEYLVKSILGILQINQD